MKCDLSAKINLNEMKLKFEKWAAKLEWMEWNKSTNCSGRKWTFRPASSLPREKVDAWAATAGRKRLLRDSAFCRLQTDPKSNSLHLAVCDSHVIPTEPGGGHNKQFHSRCTFPELKIDWQTTGDLNASTGAPPHFLGGKIETFNAGIRSICGCSVAEFQCFIHSGQ